jgi:hypothetical protein
MARQRNQEGVEEGEENGVDEGVKIKRKERGFVEGRRTLDACLKGRMGVGRKDKHKRGEK